MNFIFISPHFPTNYWHFCDHLARHGVNVLGIGDSPYDQLHQGLKDSLTEYYRVGSMENYDEMYKAVAYFAFKYGPIDWLESNNEYWMERDAELRTAFHITTGFCNDVRLARSEAHPEGHPHILEVTKKSEMKRFYEKAGVPSCRFILSTEGLEAMRDFAAEVGYPLIVRPNVGEAAFSIEKIDDDEALAAFHTDHGAERECVVEPYVTGDIWAYDAIIDAEGNPIFESNSVWPPSMAAIVVKRLDCTYYATSTIDPALRDVGRRTIKAYGVKSRFVHCEFFRLAFDHPSLGRKGDFVGLSVNMRPGGGFTPDVINYAHDTDVYGIWADMVCGAKADPESDAKADGPTVYVAFAGLRDGVEYEHSHDEIIRRYSRNICMNGRVPDVLANALGNRAYIARFATAEEKDEFFAYATSRR